MSPSVKGALIATLVAVALGSGVFVLHSHASEKPAAVKSAPALTVETTPATSAQWPEVISASGPIAAWQEAVIGSEISGQRLVEVAVNVGDKVKKGDVLARFNADTLRAEQAELQADFQQAESERKRAEGLKSTGGMSVQQIESTANAAAVAKAKLDAKTLQLQYATVVAPADGTVSARTATLGSIGAAGGELFRLILDDRIEWRGELNARQLAQVKIGQAVALELPDGTKATAKIRQLSPALDPLTRLAMVYADILPGGNARAGMYAKGIIAMDDRLAIVVPAVSVVIRDGHSYVFTLADGSDKVSQRQVTTGRHQGDEVEITDGLDAGSLVVTQGAGFLNDADIVRVASRVGAAK